MNLPVLLADIHTQRWNCNGCTNCCRELVVHLTRRDIEEIDRQNWAGRLGTDPYVRLRRETVLNHREGGGCVFLSNDGRCRIHTEFGEHAKPLACQLYPFTLHREPEALRAALRFDCPSAAANKGTALPTHKKAVARLAHELDEANRLLFAGGGPQAMLRDGRPITGEEQAALISRMDRWLGDMRRPLADRLTGMIALVDTFFRVKLNSIRDDHFVELLDMLVMDLPEAVADAVRNPLPPPTDAQLKLLRLTIFAHCEYITLAQARQPFLAGIAHRFDQLKRSSRFASGTGVIPELIPGHPTCRFEDVYATTIDAGTLAAAEELITRYLRARLLGGTSCGAGYYHWAALDGLRSLVLSILCADWLARYLAASSGRRELAIEDYRGAISIVDRTAGRARELGTRSAKLRISYLAREDGFLRILLHSTLLRRP